MKLPTTSAALLLLSAAFPVPFAAEVTLVPVADTTLIEIAPDNNMGAHEFVNAGTTGHFTRNRGLFKFDPAAVIPSGAKITSVELLIEVVGQPPEPASTFFHLHRVLQLWDEGTRTSPDEAPGLGSAHEGGATWNHRMAAAAPWTIPGGAAGTDYVATSSAAQIIYTISESPFPFGSTTNLVADVQLWLDEPESNLGWILIAEDEATPYTARRFGAREDPINAPLLRIDYTPPPRITGARVEGNQFRFSFVAEAGQAYTAEYRPSLSPSTPWTTLATLPPQSEAQSVVVTDSVSSMERFYRIVVP